eukprot:gene9135-6422_t
MKRAKKAKLPRGHNASHSKQPSLREMYLKSCSENGIHPNSGIVAMLPEKPATPFYSDILDVSNNYLGDKGMLPIIAVASKISGLRSLVIRENGLRNKSVQALCTMALKHPSLEHIDLSDNYISDGAGVSIEMMLRGNRRIVDVVIDNTKIDVEKRVLIRELIDANRADLENPAAKITADGEHTEAAS